MRRRFARVSFRPVCRVPWPSISPLMKLKFLPHVVMVTLCHFCLMKLLNKFRQIVSENTNDQILRSFGSGSKLFSFY